MKGCEIAKELGVDSSTESRDIQYLIYNHKERRKILQLETSPLVYNHSVWPTNLQKFVMISWISSRKLPKSLPLAVIHVKYVNLWNIKNIIEIILNCEANMLNNI